MEQFTQRRQLREKSFKQQELRISHAHQPSVTYSSHSGSNCLLQLERLKKIRDNGHIIIGNGNKKLVVLKTRAKLFLNLFVESSRVEVLNAYQPNFLLVLFHSAAKYLTSMLLEETAVTRATF